MTVWLLPFPALSADAHHLAAIGALTVVWWTTEAIPLPVTALVATVLVVLTGVATAQDAFAQFASPTIFVFLGAFIMGRAISEHALDRRFAQYVLTLPAVSSTRGGRHAAIALLTPAISAWMNNTATAAMMTPIAVGVLGAGGSPGRWPGSATAMMLVVAYASTLGGLITPVGAAPNLVTIGLNEGVVAILAASLLFVLPTDWRRRQFTLTWRQASEIIGDGSALYASEALWTAAHRRTHLLVVVLANGRYATLNEAAGRLAGHPLKAFSIEPPRLDFSGLATLYGWKYHAIASEAELNRFLDQSGRTITANTLVEIALDPAVKPVMASRHF